MSTCRICDRQYTYNRAQGHRKDVCNSCRTAARREGVKAWAVEYMGGVCRRCGWTGDYAALEFHHEDETTKEFEVGKSLNFSPERIKRELDKCEMLCANCHAIETAKRLRAHRTTRSLGG